MKKLIVLMIVLIPAAVFAAKDVSSAGHNSLSPRQVCVGMEKIVLQLMRQYLSMDRSMSDAIRDNDVKNMNLLGKLKETARKDARDLSTIFQTFCGKDW